MKVLIGCEFSATVRDAFRRRGHEAYSCDLLPTDGDPAYHMQCDVIHAINAEEWDLVIAHPPCTYLAVSGLHWNKRNPERAQKTEDALKFIKTIWDTPHVKRLCIENPVGCINSRLPEMPKPQYIQPYEFGDDASKKTGLWLRGLPNLIPLPNWLQAEPRITDDGKKRWANQTDSGQNKLPPSEDRWKIRSKTYQGIAKAMADQWGDL